MQKNGLGENPLIRIFIGILLLTSSMIFTKPSTLYLIDPLKHGHYSDYSK